MKIGILGGTFDPVHAGHIGLAQAVIAARRADRVLFIPNANPPHKSGGQITPYEHRVRMLELALEGCNKAELCEIEAQETDPNYTVDTVRKLRTLYGNETEFLLIVGSDEIRDLADWKEPRKLLESVDVLVVSRTGWNLDEINCLADSLGRDAVEKLKSNTLSVDLPDVSSTDIRERVASGGNLARDVALPVARYIATHKLYMAGA